MGPATNFLPASLSSELATALGSKILGLNCTITGELRLLCTGKISRKNVRAACLIPNNCSRLTTFDESKCLNCRRDRVVLNVLCEVKKETWYSKRKMNGKKARMKSGKKKNGKHKLLNQNFNFSFELNLAWFVGLTFLVNDEKLLTACLDCPPIRVHK